MLALYLWGARIFITWNEMRRGGEGAADPEQLAARLLVLAVIAAAGAASALLLLRRPASAAASRVGYRLAARRDRSARVE